VRRKERAPNEIVGGEMRLPSNHAICLNWGGRGRAVKQAGKSAGGPYQAVRDSFLMPQGYFHSKPTAASQPPSPPVTNPY
jgi:hypothetical protein